jgi:type VI secretion system protein ImpK
MFASGQARVLPRFETVLSRVADALNGEEGRVIVEGHSDAQPINTARFPSNFHLSEARAASAASFMGALLNDADRLQVIGLGATQLLDRRNPNAAVNRRVELVLDRPLE